MKINFMTAKEIILGPLATLALLQNIPLNTYLLVLLTTMSLWKEYSISNFLALLSHTI